MISDLVGKIGSKQFTSDIKSPILTAVVQENLELSQIFTAVTKYRI